VLAGMGYLLAREEPVVEGRQRQEGGRSAMDVRNAPAYRRRSGNLDLSSQPNKWLPKIRIPAIFEESQTDFLAMAPKGFGIVGVL
jgi:hypothetical protein